MNRRRQPPLADLKIGDVVRRIDQVGGTITSINKTHLRLDHKPFWYARSQDGGFHVELEPTEEKKRCRMCDRTSIEPGSIDPDGTPTCWMDADLCSTCDDRREMAKIAAHQAVEAAAELLRFSREGNDLDGPFGIDAVEKLLDAAKIAGEIEGWDKDPDERGQVYAAVAKCLEGWA